MPIMYTIDQIADFVQEETGYRGAVAEATTLQNDIGVFGDDMCDLLTAYAKRFHADMSKYLWYFHTGEEGLMNIGSLFFKAPYQRVEEIPITVGMLCDFANSGQWSVDYPEHTIPKKRIDILINQVLVGLFVVALVFLAIWKHLG